MFQSDSCGWLATTFAQPRLGSTLGSSRDNKAVKDQEVSGQGSFDAGDMVGHVAGRPVGSLTGSAHALEDFGWVRELLSAQAGHRYGRGRKHAPDSQDDKIESLRSKSFQGL